MSHSFSVNATTADVAAIQTVVDIINTATTTEVADIKAKTDNLPIDPADASAVDGQITVIGSAIRGADSDTLKTLSDQIDGVVVKSGTAVGQIQVHHMTDGDAANAGDITLATITTQACIIKSVVVRAQAAQTADLTSIQLRGGTGKVVTFIDAILGAADNFNATDKQVAWTGAVELDATKTIVMTLTGTGATAVNLDIVIEYMAATAGGTLV